jgi:uncharacterized membrane protein YebE (DUF533 family)
MKRNFALAVLITAVTLPAFAQTATPGIDRREANQERRIDQGVATGQLTPRETAKLEKGQVHVDKLEAKAKADGVVTAQERQRIQHAQNAQSRKIKRQKHDRQHDLNHDGKVDRPNAAK